MLVRHDVTLSYVDEESDIWTSPWTDTCSKAINSSLLSVHFLSFLEYSRTKHKVHSLERTHKWFVFSKKCLVSKIIIIKTAVGVKAEAIFDYFYGDKSRATSGVLRDTNDATTMVKFEVQH